jgi:uncharacterized protein (DUF983 family)
MTPCERCGHEVHEQALPQNAAAQPGEVAAADPEGSEEPGQSQRCPSCGTELGQETGEDDEVLHPKAPWHFKVLIVGSVVYLGYRLYQGIGWLIHHA